MSRNILLYTLFFLLSFSLHAEVTKEELSKNIDIDKLQHPYLFFSNDEKQAMLERIKSDKECRNIWESLLARGHRFLYVPVKNPAPVQPKHPRYETDDQAAPYVNELSEGAVTLAFLYQMTGNETYAKKAIEFAIAISDLEGWVDAAHKFDIIYPRVWPYNVPDDQVVFSYDIFAAGKALILSTVYDWVYPVLTMPERDKIRNGLLEKAVLSVRGNYEFFWWSTAYRCNWSAICNSGLGVAALAMIKENPELIDVVAESYNGMNLTFDQIDRDGGWQEGRGYYVYMMYESSLFMEALKRVSNGRYNMFKHEKISSHPIDFLLYGLTANFGDSEGGPTGSTFMVNKLTEETGNGTASWYRNKFLGEGSSLLDIIWPRSKVEPVEPEQKSKLFRDIDWAIMRSDFLDTTTVTIACKAGFNNDPHHGHLDCGQFALTWYGVPFIRDIGRMRYDEFYFNEDRYDYPFASSEGHNLIFVNGERQIIAKKKNQPWKDGVGGRILDFQTSAKRDYVLMDPTHAYPGKELKKWRRNIILEKPSVTLVLDEVDSKPGAEIRARFFPGVTGTPIRSRRDARFVAPSAGIGYKVMNNYVLLTSQRHNMALIPLVMDNNFTIVEDNLSYVPVTEDGRLVEIPYVETVTKAKTNTSIILTIILPVSDQREAEQIVKSVKVSRINSIRIEVSTDTAAGNFKWVFEKDKNGFVLK